MSPEDLTPAEREEVQLHFVRAWLGRTRRQQYARVRIQRFDVTGQIKGTKPVRKPIDGATGDAEHCRRMAEARRKSA